MPREIKGAPQALSHHLGLKAAAAEVETQLDENRKRNGHLEQGSDGQ